MACNYFHCERVGFFEPECLYLFPYSFDWYPNIRPTECLAKGFWMLDVVGCWLLAFLIGFLLFDIKLCISCLLEKKKFNKLKVNKQLIKLVFLF